MAKSKSKKKRNLNSQPSSSQIDNRADLRALVWRGQCDGEHVQAPLLASKSSILTFTDSNFTSFLYQNLSGI
ncbi:BnaA02g19530D [Brassica napus]|uniref:BnaA02g19530D protein n=1 Tax=Brassica napus TaxID=3708 RepID=A0A078IQ25_BRANA|nr:BnaA02g19530D [Brassica napus]